MGAELNVDMSFGAKLKDMNVLKKIRQRSDTEMLALSSARELI